MIPLTRPWIEDVEIDAVARVLRSGMLVQGTHVETFETQLAKVCRRAYGIAVSNGSIALALSCAHWELVKEMRSLYPP